MLDRLRVLDQDIRVAMVGMGAMGKGLLYQCEVTPGFSCVAIADIELQTAIDCAETFDREYRVVESAREMEDAIRDGVLAVCQDGDLAARCEQSDVFIEASNAIGAAADYSLTAIEHGKHLVLMNAEIDLAFGPYLLERAREAGVMYVSIDGDQHTVIKRLVDEMQLWGFEFVMGGNIKGFLDRYSNPTLIVPEADKRNLGYKMCTAYTDGTKLCIEMALLSNALGMKTLKPGMYGPAAKTVTEVPRLWDFGKLWKPGDEPFVDYILGAEPGGGVFAVGYCDHPYQKDMMDYYKMGHGPFYLFYRPYHLCHVEAMRCIAEAVLDGVSLLQPNHGFRADVFAYAKKDLAEGDELDGIGGYACYGLIENCDDTSGAAGIPIAIAENVTLKRAVPKDGRILMSDVNYNPSALDFELYAKALAASTQSRRAG